MNDNDELAYRAKLLMVRMCGVIIPRQFINPILDELFSAIQTFPVSLRFLFLNGLDVLILALAF